MIVSCLAGGEKRPGDYRAIQESKARTQIIEVLTMALVGAVIVSSR